MHPPPSPIRNSHTHGRGATTTPSATSSTSALSTPAPGNANPAVSAALQGATLAFNKQKKAAVLVAGGSCTNDNTGRGPSPARPPPPSSQNSSNTTEPPNTNPAAATTTTGLRGDNGALLAATQAAAAREHAASQSARSTEAGGSGMITSGGVMSRHATGGSGSGGAAAGVQQQEVVVGSGSGHGLELDSSSSSSGHGNARLSELHVGGGGGGSGRSSSSSALLLPPAVGRRPGGGVDGGKQTSPSLIAATLAASRSASPVRASIPQLDLNSGKVGGRGQSVGSAGLMAGSVGLGLGMGVARRVGEAEVPDTASIPPTTSLVSLFESKKGEDDVDPVKRRAPSVRSRNPDQEEQQEQQRVKPKPKPKPKPKLSTDIGRPAPSDETHESTQAGHSRRAGHNDEKADILSPSRTSNQKPRPQPTRSPKPHADKRPPTPSSSVPAPTSSHHIPPQSQPLAKTPRPVPPTPPVRTSGIGKMTEPTVQITPVEPEIDQVDAFYRNPERTPIPRRQSQSSASSDDTFVSASSVQSRPVSPVRGEHRPTGRPAHLTRRSSLRSISTPNLQRLPAPSTPNLTLNSLTNAIVASNLASARLATPSSKVPPPIPAPRRSGRSPLQPHHTAESIRSHLTGGSGSKSPNPLHHRHHHAQRTGGGMLQTLRSPTTHNINNNKSKNPSQSDDEDARRRMQHEHHRRRNKVFLGGGNRKHAHHEGSRRRWRDEITPRERRRYEAVWASNRGLFLKVGWGLVWLEQQQQQEGEIDRGRAFDGPEAELVVNVVVRDIWGRSRLPADELAEVWDLVDRGQRGALGKDEFVVGLWLVDQRLRGRKIPARVSQSVWDSAGGGHGGVVVPLVPSSSAGKGKKKKGR
ncbi:increased rDNA silencing protein 4 [Chaetomidium leptoderma]|uniref:Increased rDNA silencing protein 4 n=1 Tax=Chaetomidium leptoderma TaxID=669021 RepID=A0AAN6VIB5_9PEZI|nr:increased rDNA silencing protein 4 [Chaetomidium leptoderma]